VAGGAGAAIGRCTVVIVLEAILHPFPYVAEHIMQTECIGGKRADRRSALVVPLAAATDAIGVGFADLVSPGMGGTGAAARGIFPFGLGEQAIVLAGHGREPSGVLARLQPGHVDDRTAAAPPAAVGNRLAPTDRNAGVPVVECQLEFGDRERS